MPDKLTDSEIAKALELEVNKKSCIHEEYEEACGLWCKHYHKWCEDMSGKNKKDNCSAFKPTAPTKRAKATLDLINRLQAENERLMNHTTTYITSISELTNEVERLRADRESAMLIAADIIAADKTLKAEAYKEFAESAVERVKKAKLKYQKLCKEQGDEMEEHMHIHFNGIVGIINNLLKELVGEDK